MTGVKEEVVNQPRNNMKSTVRIIKLTPIIVNLYLIASLICSLFDVDIANLSFITGHSMYMDAMLWSVSKRFKFRAWHRILILNMFIQAAIQALDYYMDFTLGFWYVFSISALVMIVSMITSTILYFKYGCCKIEESK